MADLERALGGRGGQPRCLFDNRSVLAECLRALLIRVHHHPLVARPVCVSRQRQRSGGAFGLAALQPVRDAAEGPSAALAGLHSRARKEATVVGPGDGEAAAAEMA